MTLGQFRAEAAQWLATNAGDAPPDYGAIMPPKHRDAGVAWQQRLYEAGWAGLHWPEDVGGRGLTPDHQEVWLEECAKVQVPPFINMVGFVLAGQGVQTFGTDAQKAEHLRPILTAERVWCQLFSEPNAGSDLAGLETRAVRDGDHYIVNGQKVWCSGARISQWGILMARTDPDAAKHRGISFFLVDMASPGVETRPLRQMTGEAEFDEVFLTDVAIPAANLLGPENDGWRVGMVTLTNERGSIGAASIGMKRRLDALIGLGGDLDPVARDTLADLLITGRSLYHLGQRQGEASVASSIAKLGVTDLVWDTAMARVGLDGAEAMLEGPAARAALAAPGGRIAGGTSQVQRNIIGERILGLPKEPRP
ncbi:MAG: acyl-CoA dehydrogenase family protein [Acidimicrobiales bacterium]